jgi:hypothetical protein
MTPEKDSPSEAQVTEWRRQVEIRRAELFGRSWKNRRPSKASRVSTHKEELKLEDIFGGGG